MRLDIEQFCAMTKTIRMLYGVHVATAFFEKNFEEMTKLNISDLHKLTARGKVQTPQEK